MTRETLKPWSAENLRREFTHSDKIFYNYAESDQDIFVLSMLDGMHNGTYLEIGAGWPDHISNTALLELQFGWSGISIDYQDVYPDMWKAMNRKTLLKANALEINYVELLSNMPKVIEYLSLDTEPASLTFETLKRLPLNQHKFKIITFEHECYCEGPAIKLASRKFLTDQGYQLVVNNVSQNGIAVDYEDWWAHPDFVDLERLRSHLCVDDSIKDFKAYLYK